MSRFKKDDKVFVVKGAKIVSGKYGPPSYQSYEYKWGTVWIDGAGGCSFQQDLIQSTPHEAAKAYLKHLETLNEAKRKSISKNEAKEARFRKYLEKECIQI